MTGVFDFDPYSDSRTPPPANPANRANRLIHQGLTSANRAAGFANRANRSDEGAGGLARLADGAGKLAPGNPQKSATLAGLAALAGAAARNTLLPRTQPDNAGLRDAWTERAAIRQFDGGMPREVAEAAAWADIHGEPRHEPPPPAGSALPDHGQPTPDLVERLAGALAVDRPWQRVTGPEGMTYFTGRALRLLERLDPLARGLLVQHEELQAARWRTPAATGRTSRPCRVHDAPQEMAAPPANDTAATEGHRDRRLTNFTDNRLAI